VRACTNARVRGPVFKGGQSGFRGSNSSRQFSPVPGRCANVFRAPLLQLDRDETVRTKRSQFTRINLISRRATEMERRRPEARRLTNLCARNEYRSINDLSFSLRFSIGLRVNAQHAAGAQRNKIKWRDLLSHFAASQQSQLIRHVQGARIIGEGSDGS